MFYKYLNAAGAKAFLTKPQIRFKDWRRLDDLMEVIPGSRKMTDAELEACAQHKFGQCAGKISLDKCRYFIRIMNEAGSKPFWEREVRKELEQAPAIWFVS